MVGFRMNPQAAGQVVLTPANLGHVDELRAALRKLRLGKN
jgi:hypothetical protein